jgi:hypothetical protein
MRKDVCTLPRLRPLARFFCAAIAVAILCPPVTSQDGRVNNHHAEAELHITATVMPVILPPNHDRDKDDRDKGRHENEVTYNLSPQRNSLSVTEEMKTMPVEKNNGMSREQVKLTTVVAQ